MLLKLWTVLPIEGHRTSPIFILDFYAIFELLQWFFFSCFLKNVLCDSSVILQFGKLIVWLAGWYVWLSFCFKPHLMNLEEFLVQYVGTKMQIQKSEMQNEICLCASTGSFFKLSTVFFSLLWLSSWSSNSVLSVCLFNMAMPVFPFHPVGRFVKQYICLLLTSLEK